MLKRKRGKEGSYRYKPLPFLVQQNMEYAEKCNPQVNTEAEVRLNIYSQRALREFEENFTFDRTWNHDTNNYIQILGAERYQ